MPIRVKIANNAVELDGVFKARHQVFVEEEGYFKGSGHGRIFDQFDSFPTTCNLAAMVGPEVVGGLRLSQWTEVGAPSDDFYDFCPYLRGATGRVATVSMFCLRSKYRKLTRLAYMMISMGVFWAISKRLEYVVAAINPLIESLVGAIGFKAVGPVFYDEKHRVNVLPTVLEVGKIEERFLQMANFQGFHRSLRTFDREFFRAGEKIIEKGADGHSAYVVIDGEVNVRRPGRRVEDPPEGFSYKIGPCEIIGEIALLTDKPQTTDAVAQTDVDCMVIDKAVFWEQLNHNPDLQLKLLRLIGHRFVDTMEKSGNGTSILIEQVNQHECREDLSDRRQ